MADSKISNLLVAATLTGAELETLVQSGANVKTTKNTTANFDITTKTYAGLNTTDKTVQGAINEVNSAVVAENLWDRVATTLSPHTSGDHTELNNGQYYGFTQPTNSTFYATYVNSINGDYGLGNLIGTAVGGAAVVNGWLDLAQSDNRYVWHSATLNADNVQQGTFKFKIKPNYSGIPGSLRMFFSVGKASGNNTNYIALWHTAAGDPRCSIYDASGIVIMDSASFGPWSPVAGTEYEFEFNFDITAGATRLFINGVQLGTTKTQTGTRSSDILKLFIGQSVTVPTQISNCYIKDEIVFNTVQHTANYTPGYTLQDVKFSKTDTKVKDLLVYDAATIANTLKSYGQYTNTVATGAAPFVISSTTVSSNLNADLLDGQHSSSFEPTVTKGNLTESTSSILTITGGTGAVIGTGTAIEIQQANTTDDGYLSSADWDTFNDKEPTVTKGNLTESTSSILTITNGTGVVIGTGTTIEIQQANTTDDGYLSSTDWDTFNGKLGTGLTDGNIFVGNVSNVATSVAMSGEASIINTGAVTLNNNAVIAKALTGYTSTTGTITSGDSVLSAIEKLNGNMDLAIDGRKWGVACRVCSTTAKALATDFENGDTIDLVVLATNNRIIIAGQADQKENGVYKVNATGAPTRDETAANLANRGFWITEGTANGDKSYWCPQDSITYGATNITFVVTGSGVYTAGTGLQLIGNQFSVSTAENADKEFAIDSDGKTAFILAHTPVTVSLTKLYLNGQRRSYTVDFTVSGTSLTWNNPGGVTLKIADSPLIVDYTY